MASLQCGVFFKIIIMFCDSESATSNRVQSYKYAAPSLFEADKTPLCVQYNTLMRHYSYK